MNLRQDAVAPTKDAANEAEIRALRVKVPLETRALQFQELLKEKKISASSTWEKELHKIVYDPRYLLLMSNKRKQVFEKYVQEIAKEDLIDGNSYSRDEKNDHIKDREDEDLNSNDVSYLEISSSTSSSASCLDISKSEDNKDEIIRSSSPILLDISTDEDDASDIKDEVFQDLDKSSDEKKVDEELLVDSSLEEANESVGFREVNVQNRHYTTKEKLC